jgi:hypothetical protein
MSIEFIIILHIIEIYKNSRTKIDLYIIKKII